MGTQILLKNPEVFPADEVLKEALGDGVYGVLEAFLGTVTGAEYGLSVEWRFYNDGKAWLGKTVHKKKTVMWLSVWEGFFRGTFFFTEKYLETIAALDISDAVKERFAAAEPVGRLLPMIIDVRDKALLADLLTVIRFKKSLK